MALEYKVSLALRETLLSGNAELRISKLSRETLLSGMADWRVSGLVRESLVGVTLEGGVTPTGGRRRAAQIIG